MPINHSLVKLGAMIFAVAVALLPVVIVGAIAVHDLRSWWRQYRWIRGLPEAASKGIER
jgi:hypothetical protein